MGYRYYSSTAVQTTLASAITSSTNPIPLASTSGFPGSFPYTLVIDAGSSSEEVVEVTSASGTSLTVTRGMDGTTALSHSMGAPVIHGVSARDFKEWQDHVAASLNVHGLAVGSAVVGTTDTQTLSNKTLASPVITGTVTGMTIVNAALTTPTITAGGSWAGNPTFSGQPSIADLTNIQHDHSGVTKGGATLNSTTLNTPTIATPTFSGIASGSLTGLSLVTATLNNPTVTGGGTFGGNPSFTGQPTITDLTNAQHDHSTAAKGGNIPESSVTNLVTDLTNLQQPPVATLRRTTDQALTASVATAIQLTSHQYDSHGGHSDTVNNTRYTIPANWGGLWHVDAVVPFNGGTSNGMREVTIRVNGSIVILGNRFHPTDGSLYCATASGIIQVNAGDFVEVWAYWDGSSGACNAAGSADNGIWLCLNFLRKP